MEWYRIANFIMQISYLIGHLVFIWMLYRRRQPTPVWRWFFLLCICTWLWVLGRFMETIVYMFLPGNNDAYVFAANFQYIGDTTAIVVYLIWILVLSGRDRAASSPLLRALLFLCPAVVCALVFTNEHHHLFYTKLVMGQTVEHGVLFLPCMVWSFLILLSGYIASVCMVIRSGRDRLKQLIFFSLFPLVPAAGTLVRSVTGVDRLDYTPLMMAVSLFSFYQLIFRYHYVNIIPASVREAIEQTVHPIGIYDCCTGESVYANHAAKENFFSEDGTQHLHVPAVAGRYEEDINGKRYSVEAMALEEKDEILVTATDITDLARQQLVLDRQIAQQEQLQAGLEEAKRNIEAYLDTLHTTEGLLEKQERIDAAYREIDTVFRKVQKNLEAAAADAEPGETVERLLRENLILTRDCIAMIRDTVADLTEMKRAEMSQ